MSHAGSGAPDQPTPSDKRGTLSAFKSVLLEDVQIDLELHCPHVTFYPSIKALIYTVIVNLYENKHIFDFFFRNFF